MLLEFRLFYLALNPLFCKTPVSRSLFFVRFLSAFYFNNCLIEVKCPNNTIGTIKVGNQLNGKFKIAIFGCSNANFCIGEGAENKALTTIFIKSPKHTKFQIKIAFLLIFCFVKPKYAMKGAVNPASMSKFRPSKVISSGIALCKKSQNKTISTGILTMFRYVKFLRGKLSINCLPFDVANNKMTVKIVGRIPVKIIFGGNEFVSVLYMFFKVKTVWIINHIVKPIKIGVDFFRVVSEFEFLIVQVNSSKVATVVSPKVSEMYVGKLSIIFYLFNV